jgi:BNR/Asp-box repeat
MKTAIVGTAQGIFVIDAAGGGSSPSLAGPSVRHVSRASGECLAGSAAGIFRSGDGGRTWQASGIGDREIWDATAAPGDPQTLYAVTEPAGLFLSRDAGASWTEVVAFRRAPGFDQWCAGRARTIVIDRQNPDRWCIGVEVGGVLLTEDGGRSWTCSIPGGNPDLHNIVAKPDEPGALFASTGFGRLDASEPMEKRIAGMFRSDDHGKTWRYQWNGHDAALHAPALHRPAAAPCGDGGLVADGVLELQRRGWRPRRAVPVGRRRRDVALAGRR